MPLYVVTNVCHTDYYKRDYTSSKVMSIHENKMDALIKAINYNFEQWKYFTETNGDVGDYYASDFMDIVDNEYHDISYCALSKLLVRFHQSPRPLHKYIR
jgi:hypothetical protein